MCGGIPYALPMERAPRPEGKIVEAANFPTRLEAEAAIDLLGANGIQASGKFGDAGGWAPHYALVDGFRILVFEDDLDAAREVLATEARLEALGDLEPDPGLEADGG